MIRKTDIYTDIKNERIRQDEIHGFESKENPYKMLAALTEELGEVAQSMLDDGVDDDHTREELIQVAATAVKMVEHIDYRRSL
jgi:NTP pyrophosphatase (non-canonical NTP hydrolase)